MRMSSFPNGGEGCGCALNRGTPNTVSCCSEAGRLAFPTVHAPADLRHRAENGSAPQNSGGKAPQCSRGAAINLPMGPRPAFAGIMPSRLVVRDKQGDTPEPPEAKIAEWIFSLRWHGQLPAQVALARGQMRCGQHRALAAELFVQSILAVILLCKRCASPVLELGGPAQRRSSRASPHRQG